MKQKEKFKFENKILWFVFSLSNLNSRNTIYQAFLSLKHVYKMFKNKRVHNRTFFMNIKTFLVLSTPMQRVAKSYKIYVYIVSSILYPVSCIHYPVSSILYPVSCIQYSVSSILYTVSYLLVWFEALSKILF